ncbi:MAG: hypothetical protein QW567_01315 [Candidatus Hadarchaeales archaeon]
MLELDEGFNLGLLDIWGICKQMKIPSQSGNTSYEPILTKHGGEIEIWYKTGPGQFISHPFRVQRFIPLHRKTFQAFGLIQAESTKKLKHVSFDFSNIIPEVVRFIMDYFEEIWGISRKNWKVYVEYWRGKPSDFKKKGIIRFWAHQLSVSEWQIKVRVGKETRFSRRAAVFGTAAIRLNSRIAQTLIMTVLDRIKTLAESDSRAAGAYLCGLLAGDGVVLEYKGIFTAVGLSFNPHSDELEHYTKVLATAGVHIEKEKLARSGAKVMYFTHWRDSIALLKASDGYLFLPHRRNAVRFYKGFLYNQYIRPLLRLRVFKERQLTAREFARLVGICKRTANLGLNRCVNLGFLGINGKGTTSSPFRFYLTEGGRMFLEVVNKIERLRCELDGKASMPDCCNDGTGGCRENNTA